MSSNDPMVHEGDSSSDGGDPKSSGLRGILSSRLVPVVVTAVVLVAGLFLVRRLGVGGRILPVAGVAAFMLIGRSFMRGGHGNHGGHGSNGSHGGCH